MLARRSPFCFASRPTAASNLRTVFPCPHCPRPALICGSQLCSLAPLVPLPPDAARYTDSPPSRCSRHNRRPSTRSRPEVPLLSVRLSPRGPLPQIGPLRIATPSGPPPIDRLPRPGARLLTDLTTAPSHRGLAETTTTQSTHERAWNTRGQPTVGPCCGSGIPYWRGDRPLLWKLPQQRVAALSW